MKKKQNLKEIEYLKEQNWSWQTPFPTGERTHILISDSKEGITLCKPNDFGPECVPTGYLNFNEKPKCKNCSRILFNLIS